MLARAGSPTRAATAAAAVGAGEVTDSDSLGLERRCTLATGISLKGTQRVPGAPAFFVPGATPDTQEYVFAGLAKFANQPVPVSDPRVYSIVFDHDLLEWTASVGESLRGIRLRRVKGGAMELTVSVSIPAMVLAIFPGDPYLVVTDDLLGNTSVGSHLENPFLAGRPRSVVRFSVP